MAIRFSFFLDIQTRSENFFYQNQSSILYINAEVNNLIICQDKKKREKERTEQIQSLRILHHYHTNANSSRNIYFLQRRKRNTSLLEQKLNEKMLVCSQCVQESPIRTAVSCVHVWKIVRILSILLTSLLCMVNECMSLHLN